MRVVDRHLLARATSATLTALLAVWPFAFLVFLDRSVADANPLIAARPGVAVLLAGIISTPGVFALAGAGGAALFVAALDDARESVALQLTGTSPRRVLVWGLVPAALLSVVGAGLAMRSLPDSLEALYETSWLRPRDVPAALARMDDVQGNREVSFSGTEGEEPGSLEDLRLISRQRDGSALVVSAEDARITQGEESTFLLALEEGVLVSSETEGMGAVVYERGRAELNLSSLAGAGKRPWRRPSSRRLESLGRDADLLAGIVGPNAARFQRRYSFEPWYRLGTAFLPLLAAFPILVIGTGVHSLRRRPFDALVAFLVTVATLTQLQATAKSLSTTSLTAALVCLGASCVVPLLVGTALVGALRWRRAG